MTQHSAEMALQAGGGQGHRTSALGWAVLLVTLLSVGWEVFRSCSHVQASIRVLVSDADGKPKRVIMDGPGGGTVRSDKLGCLTIPGNWRGSTVVMREADAGTSVLAVPIPSDAQDPLRITW